MDQQNRQRGRWVFRNQRWQYIRPGGGETASEVRPADTADILRLVDIGELLGTLRVGQQLFEQPFALALAGLEGGAETDLAGGEVDWPDWWAELEGLAPGISERAREDVSVNAARAAAVREPVVGDGVLGPGCLYSIPVVLRGEGQTRLVAVLTLLAAIRQVVQESGPQVSVVGLRPEVQEPVRTLLLARSQPPARIHILRTLLESCVRTHEARLSAAYEYRLELAAEQARSRHLLMRAETLERQLLRGSAEMERVTDAGGVPMRELAAILENPRMGVTVEAVDYRVRYLNPMLRRAFGNQVGRLCYEVFKGRDTPCHPCPIKQIWEDGEESVRYTTRDPRSGRSFEVFAFPMVGEQGDKLIVEVGVEVTDLVFQLEQLRQELGAVRVHGEQLQGVLERLCESVQALCAQLDDALRDGQQRSPRELEVLIARASVLRRLAEALALPGGPGPTDVAIALASVTSRLSSEAIAMPALRVSVMPSVPVAQPQVEALLEGLLRHIHRALPSNPRPWGITHTMSGKAEAIAPGDRFHVLALGPKRSSAEFSGEEVSSLPVTSGKNSGTEEVTDLNLAMTALLVRKIGGQFWRQHGAGVPDTFFVTLPAARGD